jgi:hypothetical protein
MARKREVIGIVEGWQEGLGGSRRRYRSNLSRKLFSVWRTATVAAIQKAQRRRALPYFDCLVVPRNCPDCWSRGRGRRT